MMCKAGNDYEDFVRMDPVKIKSLKTIIFANADEYFL